MQYGESFDDLARAPSGLPVEAVLLICSDPHDRRGGGSVIYVEYFSRRPGVDLAEFHRAVAQGQEGWGSSYQEDRLVWHAGRTWRMGPEPEYVAVWHTPGAGFERIDAWDRIFRGGGAEHHERVFRRVARIEAAGCYRSLRQPVGAPAASPPTRSYYLELFQATGRLEAVAARYEERARRHTGARLHLLLHRIGRLGPDPGGLAVWALPDFAALADLAEELDGVDAPLRLVGAGTYADVGQELL
jgi:hypothetical protein